MVILHLLFGGSRGSPPGHASSHPDRLGGSWDIGGLGAFGVHLDTGGIAVIWTALLVGLAGQAGDRMEKAKAAKIVASVLAGVVLFKTGYRAAVTYFAYSGVGTVPAIVANAGVNAGVTYLFGVAAGRALLAERGRDSAEHIAMRILTLIAGMMGLTPPSGGTGSA